ncbi:UvrD-helicase domain-containing protein [Galactobacter caseinivorans]|uniref:DNA 3'-5' helicase n=1 Tax=Galactobacter caseinivorans TaxID=2676123 RepID=A0A496PHH8_9MICC|nr:UvrD-helicase domain-containing protein [Galactobacter caseinivorans]RKW69943.1 hypothetical protein DWQ67_10790 [Galactobacter caseinivorans]
MNTLLDAEDRGRIDTELGAQLFVEAGAGSGKTTHLVRRIIALLRAGSPIGSIAAITFTEKAAAELRERTRAALLSAPTPERDAAEGLDPALRTAALEGLDAAPIGTIHSFAARLLGENPLEAQLPPALQLQDEMASRAAFLTRWESVRTELFTNGPSEAIDTLLALGVRSSALEELTRELDQDWDRVQLWLQTRGTDLPDGAGSGSLPNVRSVLDPLDELAPLLVVAADEDKLAAVIRPMLSAADSLRAAMDSGDRPRALAALNQIGAKTGTFGRTGSKPGWPHVDVKIVRELTVQARDAALGAVQSVVHPAILEVAAFLGRAVVAQARERQRHGTLEFHDLLIHARDLLVGGVGDSTGDATGGTDTATLHVRLRQRYRHLLLDEFQDTDPLQAEIAVRLASPTLAGPGEWSALRPEPGRLFMVGDPKQSIYRFRRADIATYLTQQRLAGPAAQVELTTNFRSTQPVLSWINGVFGSLISEDASRQPAYVGLDVDPGRPEWGHGPAVSVFGDEGDDAFHEEARDVAALILEATGRMPAQHGGGFEPAWTVQSGASKDPDRSYLERPATLADIAILLPTRTSLPELRRELDRAGIAYSLESSSLVYSAQEVHDLLLALRALANTSDAAALVFALRTPLFGCGDDDLLRWRRARGSWNVHAKVPDAHESLEQSPVALALASLQSLHRRVAFSTPAQLLSGLIEDRRMMEVAAREPHPEDAWRRLRFVVDQAAAWFEATGGSLRQYIEWAQTQADENARVVEAVVPETGADAVRITTIHASKGRQFPLVILSGSSRGSRASSSRSLWSREDEPEFKLGSGLSTRGFDPAASNETAFDEAEKMRLLYVACTRAESRLAVSLHRKKHGGTTNSKRLEEAEATRALATEYVRPAQVPTGKTAEQHLLGPVPSWDEWEAQSGARAKDSQQVSVVAVTTLAKAGAGVGVGVGVGAGDSATPDPGFVDEPAGELPSFLGGGSFQGSLGVHGTRVGLAVHRSLELLDLGAHHPDEARIHAVVDDAARSFGAPGASARVAEMVRSALESEPVRRAAQRERWLELPMAQVEQGVVHQGIADLIYREDDGSLTVADFKTDAGITASTLESYWSQLSAYAELLRAATGTPVNALELIFCASAPATIRRRVLTERAGR